MESKEIDGINHINIYSKGLTQLGRSLSNFARTPFSCEYGEFQSVEGFYYWLIMHEKEDFPKLKKLVGFPAKKYGRECISGHMIKHGTTEDLFNSDTEKFRCILKHAIYCKLKDNPSIAQQLKESKLPFKHYYTYSGKIVTPESSQWLCDYFEEIRTFLNNLI